MRPFTPAHRPGVWLVEVLVTIGMISLLVSLLLPAVQSARGAARQSNLRRVPLTYHGTGHD